jgi:hypothetical protein
MEDEPLPLPPYWGPFQITVAILAIAALVAASVLFWFEVR